MKKNRREYDLEKSIGKNKNYVKDYNSVLKYPEKTTFKENL